jgi:hypothetical protein
MLLQERQIPEQRLFDVGQTNITFGVLIEQRTAEELLHM